MSKKQKELNHKREAEIAKWSAIGAWAVPATGIVELAKFVIKHLLK